MGLSPKTYQMLKEKLESLKYLADAWKMKQYQVDTAQFQDPLADQIAWTPVKGGGFSFKTHSLKLEQDGLMAFKITGALILLSASLILMGLLFLLGSARVFVDSGAIDVSASLVSMAVGALLILGGSVLYYVASTPIVFDKRNGFFYKGRKDTRQNSGKSKVKHLIKLEEIHALQIIKEKIGTGDTRNYSYELNLVLEDATRINVVDHGKLAKLRKDVDVLADFLEIPVWDAA